VIFDVFTVMMNQVMVFWLVMSCTDVVGYQHFEGPCSLYFQGEGSCELALVALQLTLSTTQCIHSIEPCVGS
jgi:hypothetical protein